MLSNDKNRLKHMLDAALEAQDFMKGVTQETLSQNRLVTQAVIRSFEIIGEAASKISKEFKALNPDIPWNDIVGCATG